MYTSQTIAKLNWPSSCSNCVPYWISISCVIPSAARSLGYDLHSGSSLRSEWHNWLVARIFKGWYQLMRRKAHHLIKLPPSAKNRKKYRPSAIFHQQQYPCPSIAQKFPAIHDLGPCIQPIRRAIFISQHPVYQRYYPSRLCVLAAIGRYPGPYSAAATHARCRAPVCWLVWLDAGI